MALEKVANNSFVGTRQAAGTGLRESVGWMDMCMALWVYVDCGVVFYMDKDSSQLCRYEPCSNALPEA